MVAFLALAACSSQKPVPLPTIEKPTDKSEVAQMYAKVLDKVHKMYLDEYSVGKLALSGLAGLSKLEPGATVQRKDDRVSLQINGTSVGMVAAAPINDPYAWASAMKDLIDTGRNASTKLAEAKVEKIYQVTIDGIAAQVATDSGATWQTSAGHFEASQPTQTAQFPHLPHAYHSDNRVLPSATPLRLFEDN